MKSNWIRHRKPKGLRYITCKKCGYKFRDEPKIKWEICPRCGVKERESEGE